MKKDERNWLSINEFKLCYPIEYLEYLETFELDNKTCVLIDETAIHKIDLLIKKDEELQNQKFNNRIKLTQNNVPTTETETANTLKWHGTQLEFTELIKPLIELKKIGAGVSQKETFEKLRLFFEIEKFDENDKLKDIRKRTNTPTPFLNNLEVTLKNWIEKKD
jgi:hypothetical protein